MPLLRRRLSLALFAGVSLLACAAQAAEDADAPRELE